jgi:hypothetical protein
MTPEEFKDRLTRLGLGTGAAAEALGVSIYAIMHWRSGRRPIPGIVDVALDGIEAQRKLEAKQSCQDD